MKTYCVTVSAYDNTWHITAKTMQEAKKEAVARYRADVNIRSIEVDKGCKELHVFGRSGGYIK